MYTETVLNEAFFEGPDDMNLDIMGGADAWWEHLQKDDHSQVKRVDVQERDVDILESVK